MQFKGKYLLKPFEDLLTLNKMQSIVNIIWLIILLLPTIFLFPIETKTIVDEIHAADPSESVLTPMATILGTMLSISIPLSLNTLAKYTDKYNDKEISLTLLKEPYFILLLYVLLPSLMLIIILLYTSGNYNKYISPIVFSLFGYCLLIFFNYIKMLIKYMTDFESIILEEFKSKADNALLP